MCPGSAGGLAGCLARMICLLGNRPVSALVGFAVATVPCSDKLATASGHGGREQSKNPFAQVGADTVHGEWRSRSNESARAMVWAKESDNGPLANVVICNVPESYLV